MAVNILMYYIGFGIVVLAMIIYVNKNNKM